MTNKTNGCCDKCSGVVRDENNFGRDYGCLRDECPCHSPKTNGWRERFRTGHNTQNISDPASDTEWVESFIDKLLVEEREELIKAMLKVCEQDCDEAQKFSSKACMHLRAIHYFQADRRSEVTEKGV